MQLSNFPTVLSPLSEVEVHVMFKFAQCPVITFISACVLVSHSEVKGQWVGSIAHPSSSQKEESWVRTHDVTFFFFKADLQIILHSDNNPRHVQTNAAWTLPSTERMNNHKAASMCSHCQAESFMLTGPCWYVMHSISTLFARALVPPSHMQARPT